jgi:hypothetical protein
MTNIVLPANAQRLADLAAEHGWQVEVAKGLGAKDSTALILRRGPDKLIGIWEKGRWRTGVGFGRLNGAGTRIPTQTLNQTAVKAAVAT